MLVLGMSTWNKKGKANAEYIYIWFYSLFSVKNGTIITDRCTSLVLWWLSFPIQQRTHEAGDTLTSYFGHKGHRTGKQSQIH
jgi:hypothetical protein